MIKPSTRKYSDRPTENKGYDFLDYLYSYLYTLKDTQPGQPKNREAQSDALVDNSLTKQN